jgi:1-acyl-sn-glycerol-3-phosphate acyltransferase
MAIFRAIAFVFVLFSSLLLAAPLQWIARRYDWRIQDAIQKHFCRSICAVLGVRIKAHGRLPGESPRFVVSNHVSWVDILTLSSLYPLVFLAKAEVATWPVLGLLAKLQGTIFIERGNRRKIPEVNRKLMDTLRQGRDLVVFPEGTSSDGSRVLRFNAGHFGPLQDVEDGGVSPQLSVAPVAIYYTDLKNAWIDVGWYGDMTFLPHLWSLMKRGGAVCHISFGSGLPIGDADRKVLAGAAEESVRLMLDARLRAA